jgi:hypothetical protein
VTELSAQEHVEAAERIVERLRARLPNLVVDKVHYDMTVGVMNPPTKRALFVARVGLRDDGWVEVTEPDESDVWLTEALDYLEGDLGG